MADSGEFKVQKTIPSDLLDDIASRFVLDASEAVLNDPIALCFKTEQAYWFYLDEYLEEDKSLKSMKLDMFAIQLLKHVKIEPPNGGTLENMLQEFREFKMKVPTYGGIMLNDELTHVLLAQGFHLKDAWGFPKGKINVGEEPHKCAIREVLEETGYDMSNLIDASVYLEITIGERDERLYIVEGVPMDTKFVPKTKGEIKELKWFNLCHLPANKADKQLGMYIKMIYMAIPFVKPLREWVIRERRVRINANKKKRPRRRRNKSISNGTTPTECHLSTGSPIKQMEPLMKILPLELLKFPDVGQQFDSTFFDSEKLPDVPLIAGKLQHEGMPADQTNKKFSFKNKLVRPHSQPIHDTRREIFPSYFTSEAWSTFKINRKDVYQVLDDFLNTLPQ